MYFIYILKSCFNLTNLILFTLGVESATFIHPALVNSDCPCPIQCSPFNTTPLNTFADVVSDQKLQQIRHVDPPAQRWLVETQALQLSTVPAIACASFQPPAQTAGCRAAGNSSVLRFGSHKPWGWCKPPRAEHTHTAAWGTHTWLL